MAPRRAFDQEKPKKTYVVFRGRVPRVYDTWPECQEQVDGFPGQAHQAFRSRRDAEFAWFSYISRPSNSGHHVKLADEDRAVNPNNDDAVAMNDVVANPYITNPEVGNTHSSLSVFLISLFAFVMGLVIMKLIK